ncbi:MAG: hypothetical protein ACK502_02730 [Alphaproteobacteria bacterium]
MRYDLKVYALVCVAGMLHTAMPALAQEAENVAEKTKEIELKSLFFTDKEVEKIRQSQEAYANRKVGVPEPTDFDEEEWFSQVGEIKQARSQDRYFTYPQFFLESLVFHTDVDWTIWLNGQRITPANGSQDITVTSVDKNQVTLQWRPGDFEKVKKAWAKAQHESIQVDEVAGLVFFTLKPNQTFSSYVMKVLEGKVLPVTVDYQAVEKEFQEKLVIPEKKSDDVPGAALETSAEVVLPQDNNGNSEATPAISQNPSEIIGLYETGEQKKNDNATAPAP